jgi:hypothetical protein
MRSRAKEPPNCSTRGRSRSSSPTETATKRSSKQNETLLQQPARPNPLDPGHLSDVALNQQAGREKIDFALAPRREELSAQPIARDS